MEVNIFAYDVFFSYSQKDKAVVYPLAERLKADGLRVWLDAWEIQPGDNIPAKIEEGLENSRTLILCISANAFGSDWPALESQIFRFRDPLNNDRGFIPVRLDGAELKGFLNQVFYLDWCNNEEDGEYRQLLEACKPPAHGAVEEPATFLFQEKVGSGGHTQPIRSVVFNGDSQFALSGSDDKTMRLWDVESGRALRVFEGHTDSVWSVAFSADEKYALSGSADRTMRLWEVESGRGLRIFKGHTNSIWSVAFSTDGKSALSGSADNALRLWDVESGRALRVFDGHTASVLSVAFSVDGKSALSGSADKTLRLWDLQRGFALRIFEGHTDSVWSVAFSVDGERALSGSADKTLRLWDLDNNRALGVFGGKTIVWSVALSADGKRALSCFADDGLRLWDVESGRDLRVFKGHTDKVLSVAFNADGNLALSGSADKTLLLWHVESGHALDVFEGHTDTVLSVAFSVDGKRALSGSADKTMRLWHVESGRALRVFEGHTDTVLSVAFSADGKRALSGSADKTMRLWDVESGRALRIYEDHTDTVLSVTFSADGTRALSGSADKTLRLWHVKSGRALRVFEGHTDRVLSVAFSADGTRALSGSADDTVRLWHVESGRALRAFKAYTDSVGSLAFSADGKRAFTSAYVGGWCLWNLGKGAESLLHDIPMAAAALEEIQYTNAKVLLVGESGSGKTGLSLRLTRNDWQLSDSTVGAWATQLNLSLSPSDSIQREIWLWDFGGQADQRLIHQLYMKDTAAAVLVFDGQKENVFETLRQWDRDMVRASRKPFAKLLAAGRIDAGGLRVSRSQIEEFAAERGFASYFETSAKDDLGCEELKEAIISAIHWEEIPFRSSPRVFKRLKEYILQLKDEGFCLVRFNELRDALRLRLTGEDLQFKDEELRAVLGLLAGPGVVWELAFGNWILLQPERVNAYAQAVIQTLRVDQYERGSILEEQVLRGDLAYPSSIRRLDSEEERFVLLAMNQTLIEHGLCLREHTDQGALLVFPSYFRRERPELIGQRTVLVSYRFSGFLDDIYATLVVRLHHTRSFQQDQLWRYAADFKTLSDKQLGVKLTRLPEGDGELEVYFDPTIPVEEKIIFSRYIHEHLLQRAQSVTRLRHYVCLHCNTPVRDRDTAMRKLETWLGKRTIEQTTGERIKAWFTRSQVPTILCIECEKRVLLWDELEQSFASDEVRQLVQELQKDSATVLDNESKERALVGEVISTVALAGHISREFNVSDHGIDMEIEFKSSGEATGHKLYLQLKSGDSYLRERKSDGAEIFIIKDERHVRYWAAQAFPVMLVVRNSQGEVRWMEIRDKLRDGIVNDQSPVKQIIFEGDRFDVMSVRRWGDRPSIKAFGSVSQAEGIGL